MANQIIKRQFIRATSTHNLVSGRATGVEIEATATARATIHAAAANAVGVVAVARAKAGAVILSHLGAAHDRSESNATIVGVGAIEW